MRSKVAAALRTPVRPVTIILQFSKKGRTVRITLRLALAFGALLLGTLAATAQSAPAKPKTPGDIAVASHLLAQKNEDCRREANRQKLHLLKRRRFLAACKANP